MVAPKRAPVRPRAISPINGVVLPLEGIVRDRLGAGGHGLIQIDGPSGSGKTTALQDLAHALGSADNRHFLDCPTVEQVLERAGWVIYALANPAPELRPTVTLRLAPWENDDRIEYLLARHKDECASVISRLHSVEPDIALAGNAELWATVLDAMAADPSLVSARQALQRSLTGVFKAPKTKALAGECAIAALTLDAGLPDLLTKLRQEADSEAALRVLRRRPLQILLAADRVVQDLRTKSRSDYFCLRLPRDLVDEVARVASQESAIRSRLERWFASGELQATAAGMLHAADPLWIPEHGKTCKLTGAYLSGVKWRGLDLRKVDLREADLSHADLQNAKLDRAQAPKANLANASLRGASLANLTATGADLTEADLSAVHAYEAVFQAANLERASFDTADLHKASLATSNLRGAQFVGAMVRGADLMGAQLQGADFTKADLQEANLSGLKLNEADFAGVNFTKAQLIRCDLEGMELESAQFVEADLTDALLTGSYMPDARFDRANLTGAGLAEIDWPRACLRGADLTDVSFHLGSSRSGRVGSPIASEGSRTGFYTDDYTEQDFKAPEEIRKANLRGADLRGAKIDDVDFYLVDLRDARFDAKHEAHLRRCGAILETRGQRL